MVFFVPGLRSPKFHILEPADALGEALSNVKPKGYSALNMSDLIILVEFEETVTRNSTFWPEFISFNDSTVRATGAALIMTSYLFSLLEKMALEPFTRYSA